MSRVKAPCQLIGYRRVSTVKQGESGLGLEAQDNAIQSHAERLGCVLVAVYTEVETGKRSDRPELLKALAHAKRIKGTVCVAKLDRLTRNARFLLGIVESGVDVVFCDFPQIPPGAMGKFFLTQLAAVAEFEAGLISERTKAGMRVVKARGTKIGTPENLTQTAREKGATVNRDKANAAYTLLIPAIKSHRASGLTLQQVADRLNSEGHTTRNGAEWNAVQVKRVLDRV